MKKILLPLVLALATSACSGLTDNPLTRTAMSAGGLVDNGADISSNFGPSSSPNNVGGTPANPRPPETYTEQWYTTPDQCSYSRAQAPGYRATWHLIQNPHHIGQPNAHTGCPVML